MGEKGNWRKKCNFLFQIYSLVERFIFLKMWREYSSHFISIHFPSFLIYYPNKWFFILLFLSLSFSSLLPIQTRHKKIENRMTSPIFSQNCLSLWCYSCGFSVYLTTVGGNGMECFIFIFIFYLFLGFMVDFWCVCWLIS